MLREPELIARRYRVLRPLGQGGMSTTTLVEDVLLGENVALKRLRPEAAPAQTIKDEFARLAGVFHPHLVGVRDLGVHRGANGEALVYFTSDFIDGLPLDRWSAGRSWDEIAPALADAIEALSFLHALGLRHGDFKPANVLVDATGRGTLIDLGLAAALGARAEPSGTAGYMAPEILAGDAADARADLWSVGVTLHELGRASRGAPEPVARLSRRLTAPGAADRPTEAAEVLEALGRSGQAAGPPLGRAPRLLGRAEPLQRFGEILASLLNGVPGPRSVHVHGADGSGRTRLLREMKWAAQRRCDVVEGSARASAPFAEMLGRAAGGERFARDVGSVVRARDVLCRAGQPIVLVLDDVQALDDADRLQLEALARLLEPRDPVLLLCAVREPPAPGAAVATFAATPLGAADLATWSAGLLEPAHVPELARLTGGLPAHVEAILARLVAGELGPSDLVAAAGGAAALDDRVVVALERLGVKERTVLGRLAVNGQPVEHGAAHEAAGGTAAVSADALVSLQRLRWVTRDERGWRLARPAEATAIMNALDPVVLRHLHEEVITELERAAIDEDAPTARRAWAPRLVFHLAAIGRHDEAAARLREGRPLWESRPRDWARAAGALLPHALLDPDTALAAARIHDLAGRPDQALRIVAKLIRRRPAGRLGAAWREAAACYLGLGRPERALRYARRAHASAIDGVERAGALEVLARTALLLGHYAEARDRAAEGLACDPPEELAAALRERAGVAGAYLGTLETARRDLGEAYRLHVAAGRTRAQVRVAIYQAIAEYRAGHFAAAAEGHERALELAEQHGLDDLAASAATSLGTARQLLGDWGPALASYERGLRLAVALGRRSTEIALRFDLANLHAAIGQFDRAVAALGGIRAAAEAAGLTAFQAQADALEAEVAFHLDDLPAARRGFERARERFAAGGGTRETVEMDLHLARVHLRLGERDEAAGRLASAASESIALEAADLRARLRLVRAECLLAQGRAADAVPALEEAARVAEGASERSLAAEIATCLATAFAKEGAEGLAASQRARARELWERIAASLPAAMRDAFWNHPARAVALAPSPPSSGEPVVTAAPSAGRAASAPSLSRILETNRRLNSSLSASEILERAIDAAIELTGAERGFILLARQGDASKTMEVAFARNLDRERIGKSHLKFSQSIARRVISTGETLVTTDAARDDRFSSNASVHAMRLVSVACVPVPSPEGILGAIYLDNRFTRGRFGEADLELLLGFADQVAIALRNAQLHAALARRTEELEQRTRELEAQTKRVEALLRGREREIDRLQQEVRTAHQALAHRYDYGNIVGRSPAMRAVLAVLDRVIDSPLSVIVEGESGTGKELVARAIHFNGPGRDRPFVSVNCAALPEALLEAELFGFVRGAFTGAERDREGLLAAARQGTLFLDEVGEMAPAMQAKLLRALQEREVRPLGSSRVVKFDARIVSATNRRLSVEIAQGRFRQDLFFRLGVVVIGLPPLRDRVEDIPELAQAILERLASQTRSSVPRLEPGALRALTEHAWPGNVRELENALSRAFVMAQGGTITATDLQLGDPPAPLAGVVDEEARLRAALRACGWNVSEVSRRLGIPRNTLYRRLARHGIGRARSGSAPA